MAPIRGSAAYKKKDGTLNMSKDAQSVSWTPVAPPGSKPVLTLAVSNITNLQQTPANSSKVMLKVFTSLPGSGQETHVFQFTSALTARAEADAIKDALSRSIQAIKSGTPTPAVLPSGSGPTTSAAMAIASAVSSAPEVDRDTDALLKSDIELQQSLLKANPSLSKTFMESLRTKPDSISSSQFTQHFWSSRFHLLRTFAIEKRQTRGAYNVLSTIKPKTVDNAIKLSISKEQIQLIFSQHSLVKRVYDENVPKLSEENFWSRFFQSRLFKKLKGERISVDVDASDPVLDQYLNYDDEAERSQRLLASHVPHIIDIEGNEENHSQRKGNQPDLTMRPTSVDKVPIIRTLNTLSEKIVSLQSSNDVDPSEPIGMDEQTFNSLALRDLRGDAEENRPILNVKDQGRFFSANAENGGSSDALLYAKQDPHKVLRTLHKDLIKLGVDIDLETEIDVKEESSDSDPDSGHNKQGHVGSKASLRAATKQVFAAIAQQRTQSDDVSAASSGWSTVQTSSTYGLSAPIFDRLSLTHATTTEFLHQFWLAFLSGDSSRAEEVAKLAETLDRAMDRIKAVADNAEVEQMKEIEKVKKQVREHYERTQKKLRFDPDIIKGGSKVVNRLLGSTVEAIRIATDRYKQVLAEDIKMEMG